MFQYFFLSVLLLTFQFCVSFICSGGGAEAVYECWLVGVFWFYVNGCFGESEFFCSFISCLLKLGKYRVIFPMF